jgi:3-oxoacyl-[acyl-carrier-protein] synthase-3
LPAHRGGQSIAIIGTGAYLPSRVLTNAELAPLLRVDPCWIEDRTGVRQRRVAAPDEATSDLAALAGATALADAGLTGAAVDLIVVATSTPDMPLPATACLVQAKLAVERCPAFDVEAVCAGFLYSLAVARAMMISNPSIRYSLVIGADIYSRILNYSDKRTACLFGDGAGAVVLGRLAGEVGITDVELGADGSMAGYVRIPAGGSRQPVDIAALKAGDHLFTMQGRPVREFVERTFAAMLCRAIVRAGLSLPELNLVVPHQANPRLLEQCAKRAGLAPGQVAITADYLGNTGAASVAITLDAAARQGRIPPGSNVLLMAFGGGMTWASVLTNWPAAATRRPSIGGS